MLETVHKMTKDLKAATLTLSADEARYLVDVYYITQEDRKRADNQARAMKNEPHSVLAWYAEQNGILESQIKVALDIYSGNHPVGAWMRAQKGIGPVIAAGFLAHLDIYHVDRMTRRRVPTETVGHWWSFAGLNPSSRWLGNSGVGEILDARFPNMKQFDETALHAVAAAVSRPAGYVLSVLKDQETGEVAEQISRTALKKHLARRPWNAKLKTLCWKASDCFVKVSGGTNPGYYGTVYRNRKEYEIRRNERGDNADTAIRLLTEKRWDPTTEAYKAYAAGRLPAGQIDMRARRYAVKLFLSHLHDVWYRHEFKKAPPMPYPIARLGHADYIPVPEAA